MNQSILKRAVGAPVKIYSKIPEHRAEIFRIYRGLVKSSKKINDSVISDFLTSWIRERFRFNRHLNAKQKLQTGINNGLKAQITIEKAIEQQNEQVELLQDTPKHKKSGINKVGKELEFLADNAYGRRGRVYYIIEKIKEKSSEGKITRFLKDIRPLPSIKKDPQPCYAIKFDERVYSIPDTYKELAESVKQRQEMAKIKRGRSRDNKQNIRTISEKHKVFNVVTSSNIRFYRIKGNTQPNWLSVLIKRLTLRKDRAFRSIQDLEEIFCDMREEEAFLARLGVHDHGYLPEIKKTIDILSQRIKTITHKNFS
ncbi:hypothetical protein BB561_003455 [Smittium simulii]|uniref:Uncharacterized protein n=1 Tax=Smittium simulii TaxID=133385 RepID=A0A2T9YLG0_9FUNG|nr:hypothetical protein BB561_003455 [Smittium simulii]